MSTLRADGKLQNVILSLYNYLSGRFTLTPIYFVGQDEFNTEAVDEWVEIFWSMPGGEYIRALGEGADGTIRHPMLSCTIKTKPTANIGRHAQIFDALCDAVGRVIPVNDYVGGDGTEVNKLLVQGEPEHITLGRDNDVMVSVVNFELWWQQAYRVN